LAQAVAALGFVQADPIRAPARAQDLILRHRATGYRAGALERGFVRLGLEETYLHVYGFAATELADHLLPRHGAAPPEGLAAEVLAHVRAAGQVHPRDLDAVFGRVQAANNWGGVSSAATRALDWLQHHGHLRVARRDSGIRIYAPRAPRDLGLSTQARLEHLVLVLARKLYPLPAASLSALSAIVARHMVGSKAGMDAITPLLRSGALRREMVGDVPYLSPVEAPAAAGPAPRRVRILSPFDPLVWDRRRMEHLWDWRYRFEAYTKPEKRLMGYYAMPLLWGEQLVGWVNAKQTPHGLDAQAGFRTRKPAGAAFARAFDAEVARMERFLGEP
jgi:uncharacterized protein YcaQ